MRGGYCKKYIRRKMGYINMWKIRDLKKKARGTFKRNYIGIVIICFIAAVVMGSFTNPLKEVRTIKDTYFDQLNGTVLFAENHNSDMSNTEVVDNFLGKSGEESERAQHWTRGVLSVFAKNTEGAGNFVYGVLNSINQIVFNDRVSAGVTIAIGSLIYLLIAILFTKVLLIGLYRYLLEIRVYTGTRISRILFPWSIKKALHIAWVMFVRSVYSLLWCLTIVGGFIKIYSYKLVPMIIAENPELSAKEAIKLSEDMMKGYKWRAFLIDLSFIGWDILNILTLQILGVFFLEPYKRMTTVELYMTLREKAKERDIENADKLCDKLLESEVTSGIYPINEYFITVPKGKKWIQEDYERDYGLSSLILIFFTFAMIGWLWEVLLFLFTRGEFINRGTSHGPWLPIYGVGGTVVLIVLKKFRNKPWLTFLLSMVLCGVIEYFTSLILEKVQGMRWWDYSGYFMNFQGRICLEGLAVFALGGCAAVYLVAPSLDHLFCKIPMKIKKIICVVLVVLFVVDMAYSAFVPNIGEGITDNDVARIEIKKSDVLIASDFC